MDIDIDIRPSTDIDSIIPCTRASMVRNGDLVRHQVGVYLQDMPRDPITGLAAIPYDVAMEFGYFKFDFLNLHILSHYGSKEQIRQAVRTEPNWLLLRDPEVVGQLFHLSKHYDVVDLVRPTSIAELADCLALIRPTKRHLLHKYVIDREETRVALYQTEEGQYMFKRSHATAYAMVIVLQLHALGQGVRPTALDQDECLEW